LFRCACLSSFLSLLSICRCFSYPTPCSQCNWKIIAFVFPVN
jgi:hypothetical protein